MVDKLFIAGGVLHLLLIGGCQTSPVVRYSDGLAPPHTIAVLPVRNATPSLFVEGQFRDLMQSNLRDKGYDALGHQQIDRKLANQLGISVGDQIGDGLIPSIGKTLEVDAVVVIVIAKYQPASRSGMDVTVAIYDGVTGSKRWQHHVPGPRYDFYMEQLQRKDAVADMNRPKGTPRPPPFWATPVHAARAELFCAIPTGPGPQTKVPSYSC